MSITDRVQCDFSRDWIDDFSQCLFEWQTLVGGLLALLAALLSIFFLNRQIKQTEALHQKGLERSHHAQRVIFPFVLSQICEASRITIKDMAEIHRIGEIGRVIQDYARPVLDLSDSLIGNLQSMAETTDNSTFLELLSELVQNIQISRSRLNDSDFASDREIESRMIDVAKIYALSESLFQYARFKSKAPPDLVKWERVQSALTISCATKEYFPRIHQSLQNHVDENRALWTGK